MKSLLIGSGNRLNKEIVHELTPDREFTDVTTLDICGTPDILWDLSNIPYPISEQYDEIHAYEVLEHCGTQGDEAFFFNQFNEFHRILKPGGLFCASVPNYTSIWAFGDPGHKRVLPFTAFNFLCEDFYSDVGKTPMADYRHLIKGYWASLGVQETENRIYIMLRTL